MDDSIDQEIEAIGVVLKALSPLSERARLSVLAYVSKRLNLPPSAPGDTPQTTGVGEQGTSDETPGSDGVIHIKTLKEQKKPRSANEMAALVAYYLANLTPQGQRKSSIDQKDVETYFKIAEFPLPRTLRMTLPNAKAAGYFDQAGEGKYKLNAVGHNLVVHAMPRGGAQDSRARSRKKAKPRSTRNKPRARK